MRRQELLWYAIALDILLFNLKCRFNLEIECSTWNKNASLKSILPLERECILSLLQSRLSLLHSFVLSVLSMWTLDFSIPEKNLPKRIDICENDYSLKQRVK